MDTWDSRFPFSAEETNLFAQLHAKATKFPAPLNIKSREAAISGPSVHDTNNFMEVDDPLAKYHSTLLHHTSHTNLYTSLSAKLLSLQTDLISSQSLLRHLDLLLEAHKQLNLATHLTPGEDVVTVRIPETETDMDELQAIRARISYLDSLQQAQSFLATCSIPSVASSPQFISALLLLLNNDKYIDTNLISRCGFLMQKCWDNGLVAMDRVLDRDLVSIESYLDDRVYKDLKNHVLKPLLKPANHTLYSALLSHFLATYTQLRENFVKFVLDARLNNQFNDFSPRDQILHLIERTRLLMVVERAEFTDIFDCDVLANTTYLNRILEAVGNLLLNRLDSPCRSLSVDDCKSLSEFTTPLYNSILTSSNPKDPFGLFLKLLTEKYLVVLASDTKEYPEEQSRTSTSNVQNV